MVVFGGSPLLLSVFVTGNRFFNGLDQAGLVVLGEKGAGIGSGGWRKLLEALLIRLSVIIVVAVASFVARGRLDAGSVLFPGFLEWPDLYALLHVIFVV